MANNNVIAELKAIKKPKKSDATYTLGSVTFKTIPPTGIKLHKSLHVIGNDGATGYDYVQALRAITDPSQHDEFDALHDREDFEATDYLMFVNDVLKGCFEEDQETTARPTKRSGSRSTGSQTKKTSTDSTDN